MNIGEIFSKFKNNPKVKIDNIYKEKVRVLCTSCKHKWSVSHHEALNFYQGCFKCNSGNYSIDEIMILTYIIDKHFKEYKELFRLGKNQLVITFMIDNKEIFPGFYPPRSYSVDGFIPKAITYDNTIDRTLTIDNPYPYKGTVFEILGDYHHSNPEFYKPNEISPKKTFTHKENYEYTINRLKHIESLGYKVFYIWVSDFKRFSKDLEKDKNVNIFDYMNIKKDFSNYGDRSFLPKSTQRNFIDSLKV